MAGGVAARQQAVFVFQGGGALGAYQAGAYQALAESGYFPDWVAGTSIGAFNSAIIAGNPPEQRVSKLRQFWEAISTDSGLRNLINDSASHAFVDAISATNAIAFGQRGFFTPRLPPWWLQPRGTVGATSVYDTSPLLQTLGQLVDFELLNSKSVRFSAGAVNVRTGQLRYFDNFREEIRPTHVMASGALPPAFPAIADEGEEYWDGGIFSNTPLDYVLAEPCTETLLFQVDLFSPDGPLPRDMADVEQRRKDITYASRNSGHIEAFQRAHDLRAGIHHLARLIGDAAGGDSRAATMSKLGCDKTHDIVHLTYRRKNYETQAKDYEFSRASMEAHWRSGYEDARRAATAAPWRLARAERQTSVAVHEFGSVDRSQ